MPKQFKFDEDGECFLDQYKSRSKNLKFSTGHTYRNLKRKDYYQFNKDGFVGETNPFGSKERSEFENGIELILSKKLKGESNQNNLNDRSIIYSMNKKKRWLLPILLEEKASQMFKCNAQKDDANESDKNAVAVFYHEKSFDNKLFGYFDSNGKQINNKRIDYKSIDSEIFNIRSWRSRQFRARNRVRKEKRRIVNLKKYFKTRHIFKNGNRNRNSGIKRRNEAFISLINNNEVDLDGAFNNLNVFKYFFSFILPHMRYKTCKSWRSGLKSYPGVLQADYGVRKNSPYQYYMRRKTRVLIKHTVKQKKYNEMFNFTKYILTDDNVDYFKNRDHIYDKHSGKTEQVYLNTRPIFDFSIQTKRQKIKQKLKNKLCLSEHSSEHKCNIVEVSEDDYQFFKYIKKLNHTDDEIKETNQELITNHPQLISLNDTFFSKFIFKVSNKVQFANSIKNTNKLVEINSIQNSYPKKLVIKLDNLIKERYTLDLQASLIFDLVENSEIFDYIFVNIDFNELVTDKQHLFNDLILNECLRQITYENISNLIENFMNSLAKFVELNGKDLQIKQSFYNVSNKSKHIKHTIGEISVVDQIDLNRFIERVLNKSDYCNDFSLNEKCLETLVTNKNEIIKQYSTCYICYDDLEWPCNFVKLEECGHEACIYCWQEYVKTKISNMKVTTSFHNNDDSDNIQILTCLHDKCKTNLSLNFLSSIISSKIVKKYVEFYTDLMIIRNRKKYVYCKNSLCKKILVVNENSQSLVTICECGYMLCNFCLMDMHFPALCSQANEYFKYIQELKEIHISEETELYTSEGKNCPNCGNYMEKNMGCNHMSCVCGFQFCWLCLKDFYSNHNSNTGYACLSKPVALTVHDSSSFISIKNSRFKNSKNYFSDIMNQYRKNKKDPNFKYSINQGFQRITFQVLNQIARLIKSKKFNENSINLYKHFNINSNDNDIIKKVSISLNKFFSQIEINFFQLNNIIEYLALFLNSKDNIFICKSKISFKPILKNSLNKAIYLFTKINELVISMPQNEDSIKCVLKLIYFDYKVSDFIKNLKHIFVNSLKIYENQNSNSELVR